MDVPRPRRLPDLDRIALLVIDVQQGFEDAATWGRRNNPGCERNIAALVGDWRARGRPVVVVRHDSEEPDSTLRPDRPGNALKPFLADLEPDLMVVKDVNSAFHGDPDLEGWLHDRDLLGIAITGISTNHCCETTARVGGNLGFDVLFALDATHTFDREGPDRVTIAAEELARVTATNLHDEFATVVSTRHLLEAAPGAVPTA